jgi:hypothetical protein
LRSSAISVFPGSAIDAPFKSAPTEWSRNVVPDI